MPAPPVVLTIAGSDPSGGAGIQADLKTFAALGVYGATVLTALTAQNTRRVDSVMPLEPAFVRRQLLLVIEDLEVRAAKTGMLGSTAVLETVASELAARPLPNLVVDPVLVSTSGAPLLETGAIDVLRQRLLPLATLVTPNLHEAGVLVGRPVSTLEGMRGAARDLVRLGARAALVTGGHLDGEARDVLFDGRELVELSAPRRDVRLHGAGCTLSAATAANLALGLGLREAVAAAKRYVTRAIEAADPIGHGARPLAHGAGN